MPAINPSRSLAGNETQEQSGGQALSFAPSTDMRSPNTSVATMMGQSGTATVLISGCCCADFWVPQRIGFEHGVDGDK